jgi:hypothetical protein
VGLVKQGFDLGAEAVRCTVSIVNMASSVIPSKAFMLLMLNVVMVEAVKVTCATVTCYNPTIHGKNFAGGKGGLSDGFCDTLNNTGGWNCVP